MSHIWHVQDLDAFNYGMLTNMTQQSTNQFKLSFMGQGQLENLGKLATFACKKIIAENPNCVIEIYNLTLPLN